MSTISSKNVLTEAKGNAYLPVVDPDETDPALRNKRIYISTIAASAGNFAPYDPDATYNRDTRDFASYNSNVYEYIFPTPSTGKVPTNTSYWKLASAGQFAHIQNTDLGTRNNSFDIQYQSQNQDVDGDTVLIFRGGQGGGTDTAIRNHWDASTTPATRKLQYTNNYTGTGSDVWEDFDLSNVARLDGYNEFTGVFGLIYEAADVDARFFVYINGEAVERLTMNKEGKFQLSDGTTPDPLATWFRQSAGRMATDGKFNAIGGLQEGGVNLVDKYAMIGTPPSTEELRAELTSSTLDYSVKFQYRDTPGLLDITSITNPKRVIGGVYIELAAGVEITFDAALNVKILALQDTTQPSDLMLLCVDKTIPLYTASFAVVNQPATGGTPTPITPAAPTNPVTDDTADEFKADVVSGYTNVSDYEYKIGAGTYAALPVGSTVTGGIVTLPVGNVAIAANDLSLRVKAMGGNNAGNVLTNPVAFTVSGGGGAYDADAQVYFDALELAEPDYLTTDIKDAYDAWVTREKNAGRYSKYNRGIFPMLGTTAAAQAVNAYTPGVNHLIYDGGTWAHTINGMQQTSAQNGAGVARRPSGAGLEPSRNNNHCAIYINADITTDASISNNGCDLGAADGVYTAISVFDGDVYFRNATIPADSTPNTGSMIGYHILTRTVSTEYHYSKRGSITTFARDSEGQHSSSEGIGGFYGLGTGSSQRRYAFATFGAGLTTSEATDATTSMNTLQTELNRA